MKAARFLTKPAKATWRATTKWPGRSLPGRRPLILHQCRRSGELGQIAGPADEGIRQGDAELLVVLGQGAGQRGVALLAGGGVGAGNPPVDGVGLDRLPLAGARSHSSRVIRRPLGWSA